MFCFNYYLKFFLKGSFSERQKFSVEDFISDKIGSKTNGIHTLNKKLPIFSNHKNRQSGNHGTKGSKRRYKYLRPITLRPILSDSLPFSAFI